MSAAVAKWTLMGGYGTDADRRRTAEPQGPSGMADLYHGGVASAPSLRLARPPHLLTARQECARQDNQRRRRWNGKLRELRPKRDACGQIVSFRGSAIDPTDSGKRDAGQLSKPSSFFARLNTANGISRGGGRVPGLS
jgi:hypothetical protein